MPLTAGRIRFAVIVTWVIALIWLPVGPAGAVAPGQHGYWWRLNGGALGGVAPQVADGGLWVAADPLGPQAVSALRATIPADHELRSLVLVEDSRTGNPELQACRVVSEWSSPEEEPGAWGDRPETDCETPVEGAAADGEVTTWTFPVGHLAENGVLDVAIVPVPDSNFSVTFESVDDGTVVTEQQESTSFDFGFTTPTTGSEDPAAPAAAGSGSERTTTVTTALTPAQLPVRSPSVDRVATTPPTPTTVPAVQSIASEPLPDLDSVGGRAPIAIVLVGLVLGTWMWRTRQVVLASDAHPLAGEPFTAGTPALAAEGLLGKDEK